MTLDVLLARLEALNGHDRELDRDLTVAIEPGLRQWSGGILVCPADEPDYWVMPKISDTDKPHPWYLNKSNPADLYDGRHKWVEKNPHRFYPEKLTSSTDAAMALVKKSVSHQQAGFIMTDSVQAWREAYVLRDAPFDSLARYIMIGLLKVLIKEKIDA